MYLAHSNFEPEVALVSSLKAIQPKSQFAIKMAYKRFLRCCKKNEQRIKEIQKVMPEWKPVFNNSI